MTTGTRRVVFLALAGLLVLVLGFLGAMAGEAGEARGSSLSRGPAGWLAARKYLEARGAEVTLWREPLDRFEGHGALVVTFPWQHGASLEAADAIEAHLQRGGDVVLAWSGGQANPGELLALVGLGFEPEEVRKAPLGVLGWRKFIREEWDLEPALPPLAPDPAGAADRRRCRIWAPRRMPGLPRQAEGTEVLYRAPTGRPAVVRLRRHRGSLWLLPADALANARLGAAGNADLLETLLARLGPRWTFDEYHHGLVLAETAEDRTFLRILDLVLWHLALLYVLAVMTLSRRFGAAWSEPPVVTGSVGSFLLGLGALHHRLNHHEQAARRLLERTRELFPDLPIPEALARRAHAAGTMGPRDLVEMARALVELRRGRRPAGPAIDPATASGDLK